jgi:hypothetical protein
MAIELLLRRRGAILYAADELAEEDMLKLGDQVMATLKTSRSIPFDRLYRLCLARICQSGGYDKGTEALHELTKTLASFVEIDVTPRGELIQRTKSIGHKPTDAAAFHQFFENAITAWKDHGYWDYLPADLRSKIEDPKTNATEQRAA